MKPVKQTIINEGYANCLQACVASYFELPLDKVPNFILFKDSWWEALHCWLNSKGYNVDHINELPPNDDNYYIVSEEFGDKYNYSHAVIWRNGSLVHDPMDTKSSIKGTIVGYYNIKKV